LKGVKRA